MSSQPAPIEQERREEQAAQEKVRQRYLRFAHRCVACGNDALASTYFRMAAELEQPQ